MRRTRLRPKRIKPRRADVVRTDEAYVKFVKSLPCSARHVGACFGPIDPHHAGLDKGMGLKPHDRSCVSLCRRHHEQLHDARRPFEWTREERREWLARVVDATQAAWAARHPEAA